VARADLNIWKSALAASKIDGRVVMDSDRQLLDQSLGHVAGLCEEVEARNRVLDALVLLKTSHVPTLDSSCDSAAAGVASNSEFDAPKNAKWYDAVGPQKPGLSAMVNLGTLHLQKTGYYYDSVFVRAGKSEEVYDRFVGYKKVFTHVEYPGDVQQRAAESSSLLPVLVFLRKTIKGHSYPSSTYYYNRAAEPDKHTPVDIASCFWVEKGSLLTQAEVMKKMQSTIRHAVPDGASVDAIVAEMESGGEGWRSLLHVSVLENVTDGTDRRAFPAESLEVGCGVVALLTCVPRRVTPFTPGERAAGARSGLDLHRCFCAQTAATDSRFLQIELPSRGSLRSYNSCQHASSLH
jgi:hypothetical protein